MRQILIDIDCGETQCQPCEFLTWDGVRLSCDVFGTHGITLSTDMPRPTECLEAERKAKEVCDELE